jgi:hypothetical protein
LSLCGGKRQGETVEETLEIRCEKVGWRHLVEKQQVLDVLQGWIPAESIENVLKMEGRESKRVSKLPGPGVVWLVIAMGVWGDLNMKSLWRQVVGTLKCLLLAGLRKFIPVRSAYSEARKRLGCRPLRRLFQELSRPIATQQTRGAFYKGMRLWATDGVTFDIPDTQANAKAFGRPGTVRDGEKVPGAYPQIHLTLLEEIGTHLIADVVIKGARADERRFVRHLLRKVDSGSLSMYDRGFFSYELVRQHSEEKDKHFLVRVPAHVRLKPIRWLEDGTYLAEVRPPRSYRGQNRTPVVVRVIEYTLDEPNRPVGYGERHRLATDLLDPQRFPAVELVVLYHERWEVEIGNDEVKTHQIARDVTIRSRTPAGVVQETYGILLAYNAIRYHMHQAAVRMDIDPRRLSFIHAVRVIREAAPLFRLVPGFLMPLFQDLLTAHIGQEILPPRANRSNPRVIKRKMSNFAKKRPEHYKTPQPRKTFKDSVVLLV